MDILKQVQEAPKIVKFGLITFAAATVFQTGREVERPGDADARLSNPVTWVAAPIADAIHGIAEMDK